MARQPDIHYVPIYTYGTAARKLEPQPKPKRKKAVLPKVRVHREKHNVVYVDPVAICAMAAAGLLLISMVAGMIRLGMTDSQNQELEEYVAQLQEENAHLDKTFQSYYDPQQVEQQAKEQGMISVSEAEHVQLELILPQQPSEPGFWEQVKTFFGELFA